jgi:FkbM family methyltransferase
VFHAKCRHGEFLLPTNDTIIAKSMERYGEYSEDEVRVFEQIIRPGSWVLDVGANMGVFTIPLSRIVGPEGRVIAFEPQPAMFGVLRANCELNEAANAILFHAATDTHGGSIKMPVVDYSVTGNFGSLTLGSGDLEVPALSIDSLALPFCHFMKIDVEGMECQTLVGAEQTIQQHRPIIYVENDRKENSHGLISLLRNLRYKMWWHLSPVVRDDNFKRAPIGPFKAMVSVNMICVPEEFAVKLEGFAEVEGPLSRPSELEGVE